MRRECCPFEGNVGVLTSASLAVYAIGQGLAQATGKQGDRLLSNEGMDMKAFFGDWVAYGVDARPESGVALDGTSFAREGHETRVRSMRTRHGRATPLMGRTVPAWTRKGNQRRYEEELLRALGQALPQGVKGTVVADRGFGNGAVIQCLEELGFEYVLRIRGDFYGHQRQGRTAPGIGLGGQEGALAHVARGHGNRGGAGGGHGGVRARQRHGRAVVWGGQRAEDSPPYPDTPLPRRWDIETSFRDLKDLRFGLGRSALRIRHPQRRDRLLLLSALPMALLTLPGAAGESLGYHRWLKANTVKTRTHSRFRQGLMLYQHIPNWPEHRLRPRVEKFAHLRMEQRPYREIFGVT